MNFLQAFLDSKNVGVCDDLVEQLHHHYTAGLLAFFASATYLCAISFTCMFNLKYTRTYEYTEYVVNFLEFE